MDTFYPGVSSGAAETVRGIRIDGQATYHVSVEPLTPSVTGSLQANGSTYDITQKNFDNLRRRIQAALNPKRFGILIYTSNAGSFRLSCRPIAGASIDKRIGGSAKIDIEWISDEPHWTLARPTSISVGVIKKMWRFPWAIAPTVFGSILSRGLISNPTDIPIYPKITISETESTKITVGNSTTGAYTTISHNIERGQKLELDMSVPSAYLISEDGAQTDVIHWTTLDSEFPWTIEPGENEIYSAVDNPELSPIITAMWYQPEGGI